MRYACWAAGWIVVSTVGCSPAADPELTAADEPEPIDFRLSDFQAFPPDADWFTREGGFGSGGLPKGYVYSRQPIGRGRLELEYRVDATGEPEAVPNTGVLLFIEPPHKTWPVCLEVQGKQSEAGRVKANGGADDPQTLHDDEALAASPNPPGEWNELSIQIGPETLAVTLNGRLTASSLIESWKDGPFGLQAEGNPVSFRNVRFTPVR